MLTPIDEKSYTTSDFLHSLEPYLKKDFQIEDAFADTESNLGTIVKWSGLINEIDDDHLIISSFAGKKTTELIVFVHLDHPISGFTENGLPISANPGQYVRIIGKYTGFRDITIALRFSRLPQFNTRVPYLDAYLITRHNDNSFLHPIWVTNRIDSLMQITK